MGPRFRVGVWCRLWGGGRELPSLFNEASSKLGSSALSARVHEAYTASFGAWGARGPPTWNLGERANGLQLAVVANHNPDNSRQGALELEQSYVIVRASASVNRRLSVHMLCAMSRRR